MPRSPESVRATLAHAPGRIDAVGAVGSTPAARSRADA